MADGSVNPGPLPPGWRVFCGKLEPINTLEGAEARGESIYGACYADGCKRSQQFHLAFLRREGLTDFELNKLERLYRCHRIDWTCDFKIKRDPPTPRLTLGMLHDRPGVKVRLLCETPGCAGKVEISAKGMAHQLQARGVGDRATRVFDVPGLVGPCKVCSQKRWTAQVAWPDPDGAGRGRSKRIGRQGD